MKKAVTPEQCNRFYPFYAGNTPVNLSAKLLVELVDTTAGINEFLLAGIEGMALCANIHVDVVLGGSGGVFRTASANDHGILVGGMKSFFHCFHLFLFLFTCEEIIFQRHRIISYHNRIEKVKSKNKISLIYSKFCFCNRKETRERDNTYANLFR